MLPFQHIPHFRFFPGQQADLTEILKDIPAPSLWGMITSDAPFQCVNKQVHLSFWVERVDRLSEPIKTETEQIPFGGISKIKCYVYFTKEHNEVHGF